MISSAPQRSTPCSTEARSFGPFRALLSTVCLLAALNGCTVAMPVTEDTPRIPVRHFFDAPPEYQAVRASPDGTQLARLVEQGSGLNLVVTDWATGQERPVTQFESARVTAFFWASNERLVFYLGDARNLMAVDADGGRRRQLNPEGRILQVIHPLPAEEDRILVAEYLPGSDSSAVHSLGLMSGNLLTLLKGPQGAWPESWFMDRDGSVRAITVTDEANRRLLATTDHGWVEAATQQRWNPDMQWLNVPLDNGAGLAARTRDTATTITPEVEILHFDVTTGQVGAALGRIEGTLCCRVVSEPLNGRLSAVFASRGQSEQGLLVSEPLEAWLADHRQSNPGQEPRLLSVSEGGRFALVASDSVVRRPDYLWVDVTSGETRSLANVPDAVTAIAQSSAVVVRDIPVQARRSGFAFDMRSPGPAAVPTQPQVDRTGISSAGGK